MPNFRFKEAVGAERGAKASPGTEQRPGEVERKNARRRASEQRRRIRDKRQGRRSATEKAERTRYEQSKKSEPRTLEEAVGDETSEYLPRSVYADQLLRWSECLDREQMLVLKSEDFFERPTDTLSRVLDFLDLPGWEPEEAEVRNRGMYTENMDPATRRRLEEYFEPHNRRPYEYLGADLGS